MNKEKFITICIGLSVGFIATGGYFAISYLFPQIQKANKMIVSPQPKSKNEPSAPPITTVQLNVDLPQDKISTTSATVTVTGTTNPGATLFIFANSDDKIASADATGKFSTSLKLEEGENEISVTSFVASTSSNVVHRNVTLEVSQ